MEYKVVIGDAVHVRAQIARGWLAANSRRIGTRQLGAITLRKWQLDAVAAARAAIREFGGTLIANDVGTGKTFIALALARDAERPLVVGPAALRNMWHAAASAAQVKIEFASYEALSRGHACGDTHDLLILDEAHHLRNPATERYAHVAAIAGCRPCVLLSATPVHNAAADLTALLALFMGSSAATLTTTQRAKCIVRRDVFQCDSMPDVAALEWLEIAADDCVPSLLMDLPCSVAAADGREAAVLIRRGLLRQWASSDAALASGLRQRIRRSHALRAALDEGRYPSKNELNAWCGDDGAFQLAFAALMCENAGGSAGMLRAVNEHLEALHELLARLRAHSSADAARAFALQGLRERHRGERIVAFSQYAATVRALFKLMRASGHVAALTASGAEIASGRIPRQEVLNQFGPADLRSGRMPDIERVDFLLATDLLSEGVNLQQASVVVHLDFPWTPARLEQRVGRAARMGASRTIVSTYAIRPSATAEMVLRMQPLLIQKHDAARNTIGPMRLLDPSSFAQRMEQTPPAEAQAALHELMQTWLTCGRTAPDTAATNGSTVVAAVVSTRPGAIALVCDGDHDSVLVELEGEITDDVCAVLAVARSANTADCSVPVSDCRSAIDRFTRRCMQSRMVDATPHQHSAIPAFRKAMLRRLSQVVRRTPHSERAAVLRRATQVRQIITAVHGAAAEHVLKEISRTQLSDAEWIREVVQLGTRAGRNWTSLQEPAGAHNTPLVRALLMLCPSSS